MNYAQPAFTPDNSGRTGRSNRYRYPCTGQIQTNGFAEYLAEQLGASRANLAAFGRELGKTFGTRRMTLVGSGSSANLAAALALAEVTGPGEAVVAGFTFPTTLSSLLTAGYKIRVVDTEPGKFGMDPSAFKKAVGPDTKVVCLTHFLGFPANLPEILGIAERHGILVLQDACETMDLRIEGRLAHQLGALSTWSFYHPHHLSSFGGGAVISNDDEWRERIESIAHWGRACTCHFDRSRCKAPEGMHHNFHYLRPGYNLEMSELNACFGRFSLLIWDEQEAHRKNNYRILYETLTGIATIETWKAPADSVSPFVFPLALHDRPAEPFSRAMARHGVEVRSLMGGVIVDQPAYAALEHDGLKNCRELSRKSCFVGIHQTLPEEMVSTVANLLLRELHGMS